MPLMSSVLLCLFFLAARSQGCQKGNLAHCCFWLSLIRVWLLNMWTESYTWCLFVSLECIWGHCMIYAFSNLAETVGVFFLRSYLKEMYQILYDDDIFWALHWDTSSDEFGWILRLTVASQRVNKVFFQHVLVRSNSSLVWQSYVHIICLF